MKSESGGTWSYREAVGSLMWLVVWSKPEIYNATRLVARHVDDPSKRHRQVVLQIIKYALGTKGQSLTFERGPNLDLSVYTDANYSEKADDMKSVSGVAVTVGNSTVSWFSSTQKIVTLSTTEAENVELGDGAKEGLFVKAVCVHRTFSFGEEHQGVGRQRRGYQTSSKPLSSARTKHIDIRFHFIRKLVRTGTIAVEHIPIREQRADILTKHL